MNRLVYGSIVGLGVLSAGCRYRRSGSVPAIKQAKVEGDALLRRTGAGGAGGVRAVLSPTIVHWTRSAIRPHGMPRYIAYDQRYFGPAPWPDDGKHFSLATHANDLAAFLRQLDVGPAHHVGWSYGAE